MAAAHLIGAAGGGDASLASAVKIRKQVISRDVLASNTYHGGCCLIHGIGSRTSWARYNQEPVCYRPVFQMRGSEGAELCADSEPSRLPIGAHHESSAAAVRWSVHRAGERAPASLRPLLTQFFSNY